MVGAVEDVLEAHRHEPERGLVPARVEADDPGVAPQLERPLGPARRQEPQDGDDPQAHPLEARADREVGPVGLDVVVEEDVEHRLLPDDLGVGGQQRALDVGERLLPGLERAVRRQRDLDGGDRRLGQGGVVLEDADLLPHPHHGRVGELVPLARPLEVEVARPVGRERHVRQGLERHAHEEAQALPLGLDEGLHRHVAGDVVGRLGGGQGQEQADDREAPDDEPPGHAPPRSGGSGVCGARPWAASGGSRQASAWGGVARRRASSGRHRKECAIHEVYKYTGDPREGVMAPAVCPGRSWSGAARVGVAVLRYAPGPVGPWHASRREGLGSEQRFRGARWGPDGPLLHEVAGAGRRRAPVSREEVE